MFVYQGMLSNDVNLVEVGIEACRSQKLNPNAGESCKIRESQAPARAFN
jgi:hypothetical protein